MFKEHEQIVLTADICGDEGEQLMPGDVGAVIHIHPGGGRLCGGVHGTGWRHGGHRHCSTISGAAGDEPRPYPHSPGGDGCLTALYIPYVIDNQNHCMADVLAGILAGHAGRSLDVATAYFNVRGFTLVRQGLQGLGSFRLLLGDEPRDGESLGLRPQAASRLVQELNAAPFDEATLRAVEDLITFLRRDLVAVRAYQKGFLHAKSYVFYRDLPSGSDDRFQPVAAIVGSSNFTGPGTYHQQGTEPLP